MHECLRIASKHDNSEEYVECLTLTFNLNTSGSLTSTQLQVSEHKVP